MLKKRIAAISSVAFLVAGPGHPTLEAVERALAGNLCRCGAYPKILKAALKAAELLGQGT